MLIKLLWGAALPLFTCSSLIQVADKPFGETTSNCVELIGSNPRSFQGQEGLKFGSNLLPEFGANKNGLTVSFWIKVRKIVEPHAWVVIFHAGHDPHRTPATWLNPGTVRVHVRASRIGNSNDGSDSISPVFSIDNWHHAAYVLQDKLLLFYVDNKAVVGYILGNDPIYPKDDDPFYIGHDTGAHSFDGQLKNFRFYNFSLSQSQLKLDMHSAKPISTAADILIWPKVSLKNACHLLRLAYELGQESQEEIIMEFMCREDNYIRLIEGKELYTLPIPLQQKLFKFHTSQSMLEGLTMGTCLVSLLQCIVVIVIVYLICSVMYSKFF